MSCSVLEVLHMLNDPASNLMYYKDYQPLTREPNLKSGVKLVLGRAVK